MSLDPSVLLGYILATAVLAVVVIVAAVRLGPPDPPPLPSCEPGEVMISTSSAVFCVTGRQLR